MEEVKILHKTAKLAKEKGFNIGNETTSECYAEDGSVTRASFLQYYQICYRPTQSLLQKWLRDEHDINIEITSYYRCVVKGSNNELLGEAKNTDGYIFDTYEEALEEGLQEALKLIEKDLQVSE